MTVETRLTTAAAKLTLFERARLILRAGLAGKTLDTEMQRVLRPDEADCQRIVEAVHEANENLYHAVSYMVEWLWQEETQLGWLRSLDAMLARDATLHEGLNRAGWSVSKGEQAYIDRKTMTVTVTPLRQPGFGLKRTLPLLWGTQVYPNNDETEPDDVATLRERLASELHRSLGLRWRDLLAIREVLVEIADLFREPMVHHLLAGPLDLIAARVLELYEELCRRGERFTLPGRDEQRIAFYRGWVRWEDIRPPGPAE